jgi:hypothetical protein
LIFLPELGKGFRQQQVPVAGRPPPRTRADGGGAGDSGASRPIGVHGLDLHGSVFEILEKKQYLKKSEIFLLQN